MDRSPAVEPETLVYETILAGRQDPDDARKERCFLDIGSNRITMRMFRDGGYRLSHIIDIGENKIIQSIADDLNVDVNLAETYLRSNFQNCQDCRGSTRLEALVPSRDSRARTRSPSPRAWRPDFPGAAREAP